MSKVLQSVMILRSIRLGYALLSDLSKFRLEPRIERSGSSGKFGDGAVHDCQLPTVDNSLINRFKISSTPLHGCLTYNLSTFSAATC